ncbi:UDP-4-amino-4,6-dideoxy-N-acetyl-beta-L-altrosamine transaminase [Halorhodospira neutriphila]|uniref:UDP-4-amino-4, 6-dideoxy-N-acetyl-beta-L-altrosamine transaminase n=1 Tax=Halorhodospira neutriphila TaxID=168379 RepID=A0ABS1E3P0_9GAMM|nr:UDP-4-amino-4,6-dideoxy-N-acetyl-beta-L-altrosamine transaminase [Halorhodospira neutriphila]MBK1725459.1 UDP-4-amino-4,6-dideoxy-N-acetyl-beta-L-altrosamine transaminase [Halorhodospira neutriphila]
MIPYGRQEITEDDIEAVVQVLRSDLITQGPVVPRFEQAVADYCGAGYGVAVNSGTSALHLACLALGLGPGDWLWTSPITFVASANCGLYCGASVDFVDIDPHTYNMSPEALAEKLAVAEQEGRLPKVVVPVHLCGQSCDMAAIRALSDRYGFHIIEDASHAIGGRYKGEPVGCGRYSDITVFSFHPVKIITTAEGGMAVTNDAELAERMDRLRSHGITRDPEQMTREPDGPWYYQQIELGFNYRMTELQAALGLSQLQRLDDYIAQRQALAERYDAALSSLPVVTPWQHPETESAWHLYVVRFSVQQDSHTRRKVFEDLRSTGVGTNVHYIPVHTQPHYQNLGFSHSDFPIAEEFYSNVLTLPLFPTMKEDQQEYIITALSECLA